MSDELNMTEVLTLVQDFITSDGVIKSEHRKFYQILRTKLALHDGMFNQYNVEQFMILASTEIL